MSASLSTVLSFGFGSWGSTGLRFTRGLGIGAAPAAPSKVGGDDVPRRRSPHRGWDREEYEQRRQREADMLATIKGAYDDLMGTASAAVLEEVAAVVKPVASKGRKKFAAPRIDWQAIADSYERTAQLMALWQAEQDRQAEEEELLVTLI